MFVNNFSVILCFLIVFLNITLPGLSFAQEKEKITIAVLNLIGQGISESETAFLSETLHIRFSQAVSSEEFNKSTQIEYTVVERSQMDKILDQFELQNTGCTDVSCAVEFGKILSTERIIIGSVGLVGKTYSIIVRIVDIETSATLDVAEYTYTGPIDELLKTGIQRIVDELLYGKKEEEAKKLPEQEIFEEKYKKHEISIGIGSATSFEKDIFNIPKTTTTTSTKVSPDLAINILYHYNIDERFAIGFNMYGYTETISDYGVIDLYGNSRELDLDLYAYNYGLLGRWIFSRKKIQPYVYISTNIAYGRISEAKEVSSVEEDTLLNYSGTSIGFGAGCRLNLWSRFSLSLEGILSVGSAKWDKTPFSNSTGTKFDPSMTGILVNFSYMWGTP